MNRMALIFVFLLSLCGISLSAQEEMSYESVRNMPQTDTVTNSKVYFQNNLIKIDLDYRDNRSVLANIRKSVGLIKDANTLPTSSIVVEGAASPNGSEVHNMNLSYRRALSMQNYLKTIPGLEHVQFSVHAKGEDWASFIEDVKRTYYYYNRDELLEILESDDPNWLKKSRIMKMDRNSLTWKILVQDYMKSSRYASVFVVVKAGAVMAFLPELPSLKSEATPLNPAGLKYPRIELQVSEPVQRPVIEPEPEFTPAYESEPEPAPIVRQSQFSPIVLPSVPMLPQTSAKVQEGRVPVASFRTNLLVPALNFGAELPLGNKLSVAADYYFPWFWPDERNKDCFELIGVSVEGRYWFGKDRSPQDRLKGHSVGVYLAGGYYDFEKNYRGMQGEFYSTGFDYTYSRAIGKNKKMNLQFTLALGIIHSEGRTYDVFGDYGQLYPDDNTVLWDYIGPTKAAVSLVVPICKKEGRK